MQEEHDKKTTTGVNAYEEAIMRNAAGFISVEDADGFIRVPAGEYYGITGAMGALKATSAGQNKMRIRAPIHPR